MPTYEYHCEKCKKSFEYRQPMADAALTVCPKDACQQKKWGKGRVKRQISLGAGLIFKGSGFYITDYRSEGYKAAAKSDSAAKSESTGGESKAGETKKAESKPAPAEKPKPSASKKKD